MRRREFITFAGAAAAWPIVARAQQNSARIVRIGIIDNSPSWNPFREELHELGYVEGQNIAFEYRQAGGVPEQLKAAAADLAKLPIDVIAVLERRRRRRRNMQPGQFQLLQYRSVTR